MPFQKGQSGNPAGKPKGTHNKTDQQLREFLRDLASGYFFGTDSELNFKKDLKGLKPGLRAQVLERYLKYFLAPMANLKIEGEITNNVQGAVRIIIEEVESTNNYINISPDQLAEKAITHQDDLIMHYVQDDSDDEDFFSDGD